MRAARSRYPDERLTGMGTSGFLDFVQLVVDGDVEQVSRRLRESPELARVPSPVGATRQEAERFFFTRIRHYLYAGDTALHMAAAGFRTSMAKLLVRHGADGRARNRRGAEPLHYAADANHAEPKAPAAMIQYLLAIGADASATDNSCVAPLHRAVRTRSLSAVRALLDGGADVRQRNKSGSAPLHLAVQTTGASSSGSDEARAQQIKIIRLLLERGAKTSDRDGRGKRVEQAARSQWIQSILKDE
jgi:hypothetical protein